MSGAGWTGRDLRYLDLALKLAALGERQTSPNPRVGAVLVRGDRIVGRARELSLMADAFRRTEESGRAHLFTVLGEPGIGKTRLGDEFLSTLPDDVVCYIAAKVENNTRELEGAITKVQGMGMLQGGKIEEMGRHAELMAAAGLYARIFRAQLNAEAAAVDGTRR